MNEDLHRSDRQRRKRSCWFVSGIGVPAMIGSLGAGCTQEGPVDVRKLPARFEVVRRFAEPFIPVDLNGDGRDEMVRTWNHPELGTGATILQTHAGAIIDQVNYAGKVSAPTFLDIEQDGRLDVVTPFVHGDSLFLGVADAEGNQLFQIFLIDGEPRIEASGAIPWDPTLNAVMLLDHDGDGKRALVSVVSTGLARMPRGILVHSFPEGVPLGRAIIGAYVNSVVAHDFDGDSAPEILIGTTAVDNGAVAGGFDDGLAYVIAFKLQPVPHVIWSKRFGDRFQAARVSFLDLDADGQPEILAVATHFRGEGASEARLEVIEPGTWRTLLERPISEPIRTLKPMRLDGALVLVAVRLTDQLLVLDPAFEIVRRRRLPFLIRDIAELGDLDDDGEPEVALRTGHRGFAILDQKLRLKASWPHGDYLGALNGLAGRPPLLLADLENEVVALSLVQNRLAFLHRYGAAALAFLVLGVVCTGAWSLRATGRHAKLLTSVNAMELNDDVRGLVLFDRSGRIRWLNGTARRWLGDPRSMRRARRIEALSANVPELGAFFRQRLDGGPRTRHTAAGVRREAGGVRPVDLQADPVFVGIPGDPHWLVRITDADPRRGANGALHPPALLARRVARALKNPLTSVLLTLRRLQMEYREAAPTAAARMDRLTARMEEGIEELRRLTSTFLKLVDPLARERVVIDLNALVSEFAAWLRWTLPADLRLNVQLEPGLPATHADREQLLSVLENLSANAVDAMPQGGGVITVSTALERDVRWGEGGAPRDYLQLEVLDTGVGIPPEARARMFDPGFSTRDGHTGLGLWMVRTIVEAHGGIVTAESEVGTGSAFTVHLPVIGSSETHDAHIDTGTERDISRSAL